jgi:D-3-phosphoglycerate dehydrogenase
MAVVLVTEKIAPRGLELLREAGHEVRESLELSPAQLLEAVRDVEALVIRSATKVTADVIAAAPKLAVVGRAGIGLDNVDVAAATKRGVIVANAPESNVISAAEHAIALLLAQARNIPQAHAALISGRWERSRWEGVELHGKTLGIVGLGRVGSLVARRAAAFGMRLLAYDPYVSSDKGRQLGVELVSLEQLFAESDFVTIHLPKTPETTGLVNRELLAKAKPGLRLVNTARGAIVDEAALAEAIERGQLQGAALDVFAEEPTTASPLFSLPNVVVTPHLGASTVEAQDKAGVTIAEQVILALAGQFVPFAVNLPATGVAEEARPFLGLAEQLGRFLATLGGGLPDVLEVEYTGALAGTDTSMLTLAVLRGLLGSGTDEPVSYVNAPRLAEEAGLEVREIRSTSTRDYVNLITLRGRGHEVAGTMAGPRGEPRIVMVDKHRVEIPPARHMVVVRNDDRPGMIGLVGTELGQAGISISSMGVGPSDDGFSALMVLSVDASVPTSVLEKIRKAPGILDVHAASALA